MVVLYRVFQASRNYEARPCLLKKKRYNVGEQLQEQCGWEGKKVNTAQGEKVKMLQKQPAKERNFWVTLVELT